MSEQIWDLVIGLSIGTVLPLPLVFFFRVTPRRS